ncbi:SH3 domain-containing protein [Cobetia amphilecti]|uniref:SH3 domain-containing protein n=1 Tax=Cobetia amphilecti TaxID=1055104 RepID=UPI001CDAB653|nr:SH3 domain-containing protein [Cobetia amphilecti]UBU47628.1 SH3 domain-containing protein [Cobetia amphilecti]
MRAKFFLGMVLLAASTLAYADYGAGLAEFRQRNFASAAYEWRKAAEQGEGRSQFALGQLFENGTGVRKSLSKAYKWYRLSAGNDVLDAQVKLAELYLSGKVDGRDAADAVEWLERAAQSGHAGAQFQLGLMYLEGFGVEEDAVVAARWFKQAADQGHIRAQNNIGSLYENGRGVEQDFSRAFDYFSQAARQGDAMAQNNLGALYARGRGVEANQAWAVFWFATASRNGNDMAKTNIQPSLSRLQNKKIAGARVNIRSAPGTDNTRLAQLARGADVYVLGESEGWSQIYFEEEGEPALGWVATRLIY